MAFDQTPASTPLRLGMIGSSRGNGHPYSWSAIFNGYDPEYMKNCPFPIIPEYLAKQKFPDDAIAGASVTCIWTQDRENSRAIAKAARIPIVLDNMTDMIGQVDAVLLARDDAENHYDLAKPFLDAGLPIYIDKPLATTVAEAERIYSGERYLGQIFTCTALAYSREMILKDDVGEVLYIHATGPKDWSTYAIHLIEPVLNIIKKTNRPKEVIIKTIPGCPCPFTIEVFGTKGVSQLRITDTYDAFKRALQEFINIVQGKVHNRSKPITMESIKFIERGIYG